MVTNCGVQIGGVHDCMVRDDTHQMSQMQVKYTVHFRDLQINAKWSRRAVLLYLRLMIITPDTTHGLVDT